MNLLVWREFYLYTLHGDDQLKSP
ncbi:hypothetical protein CY0110_15852 [Crocosphaera chwakensis CCY0110]|uniref:Uncharacterized protein n=1 Tax=Crocosphaera chwakensis CCY0110 TaxID=391612 RepID=A3IHK2_9CHRO|nr:hypothetical protein CY0110_15852 [Crocosphaera chwakensis CCY0110]